MKVLALLEQEELLRHWGERCSHKQLLAVQSELIEQLAAESDKWDVELDNKQGVIVTRDGWGRVQLVDAGPPPGMPNTSSIAEYMAKCGIKGSAVLRRLNRYDYVLPTVQDAFLMILLQYGYTLHELAQFPDEIPTVVRDLINLDPI